MALPWIVPSFYRVFFQLALSSFFLGCAVFDWCLFGGNEAKLRLLPSFAVVFFVCFFLPGFSMPDLTWFSLQAKRIRVAAVWAHLLVVTEFFCRVLSSIERGKTRLFFFENRDGDVEVFDRGRSAPSHAPPPEEKKTTAANHRRRFGSICVRDQTTATTTTTTTKNSSNDSVAWRKRKRISLDSVHSLYSASNLVRSQRNPVKPS